MMMPPPGAAPQPPAGGGAAPGAPPAGGPPGGMGSLLGMMPGSTPSASDPASVMQQAMSGINSLAEAVKQNPQMIEVLAAVLKTHPVLRLLFLAASRRPEQKAEASMASGGQNVPPILGR